MAEEREELENVIREGSITQSIADPTATNDTPTSEKNLLDSFHMAVSDIQDW